MASGISVKTTTLHITLTAMALCVCEASVAGPRLIVSHGDNVIT